MISRPRALTLAAALGGTVASASLATAQTAATAPSGELLGFSSEGAQAERALEARFDAGLSASEIRERMRRMASAPNQVGSPHDKENAEYTLAQFKAWGWDAHIEVFDILYPTPKEQRLERVGADAYVATLSEPPIPGDPTSANQAGGLPAYLAYGGEGDVTAPLVYVNYGMPDDYEALARLGVDVKGKIVIARYGHGWRGLKPKLAYEHGAVGCIIYSDPADDGYGEADPYPGGPSRPKWGVQRGSVADSAVVNGDPLTPGYGATANAPRIPREQSPMILKIPSIPISWGDAVHFLSPMGGPVAPPAWRGALPITYHVGGDPTSTAHLVVRSNWSLKPAYDVIAVLPGAKHPDQWVIRGNHRDGWVFGAADPLSGQTAMMEEAKSIGALVKAGWRPDRTIIYASWDAEEPGVMGSTEWAETHDAELRRKAVIYINSDNIDRGILGAEGSASLATVFDQAARDVPDPETGVSLETRAVAALRVAALAAPGDPDLAFDVRAAAGGDLPLDAPGSGSDYEVFVHHTGIASIDVGFGGEGESGGVYHSAYDTFTHYDRFGDPGFAYGVALARTAGRLVLREADAELTPFAFSAFAQTLEAETHALEGLVQSESDDAAKVNALRAQRAFALAADPTQSWGAPAALSAPPALDFTPLEQAIGRFSAAAAAYDAAAAHPKAGAPLAEVDRLLQGAEQTLDAPDGLPGRPWYHNLAYAPGVYTGYGTKTLPAIREPIEQRQWDAAKAGIPLTAAAIDRLAQRVEAATRLLNS
ncbi:MAG: M28 family peptidase [Alphaproteobacteria bacterium]|nr:M28 family peptidase [Alphaproteobacteria bacterium]